MAGARVVVRIDNSAMSRLLIRVGGESSVRAADRTIERARALAPHKTGALRASIHKRREVSTASRTMYTVGSDLPYASYQEWGTGPIVAKKGKVLRFQPKGSSVFIFRPRTRGVPATHFLERAGRALSLRDFLPF